MIRLVLVVLSRSNRSVPLRKANRTNIYTTPFEAQEQRTITIMTTLVLAFLVMMLMVVAMAIGLFFGRGPIKGSCGGMSAKNAQGECAICGRSDSPCDS